MDIDSDTKPSTSSQKTPIVRGARACTVCRNAKMKCVGADDGDKPCQRCKRAGVPCVFEKHRRGRKPGSKLSEASKMLRRLEKGLNTAKLKSQSAEASPATPYPPSDLRPPSEPYSTTMRAADPSHSQPPPPTSPHYAQPPPQQHPPPPPPAPPPPAPSVYQNGDSYTPTPQGNRNDPEEGGEDDVDRTESIYPARFIQNQRNSFFRTILNPHDTAPAKDTEANQNKASSSSPPSSSSLIPQPRPPGPLDPVAAGILHEGDTKVLFDLLFLRLNPFINLFDPALHTAPYVRSRCPFLFTTLLMVCCRFWRPQVFKQCQKLAHEFSVLAFAEAWKRIEVVQAFACLTYWKDPDDNRTWTYIGYACRMAVELGLNRYIAHPPVHETDIQRLERRNRERTYLVLFIHDRSLSTQTGRHWMLPEGDLVKHSATWHSGGIKGIVRPEDVIISAFVQLRLIAAETTDVFSAASKGNSDINYDVVLRNTNGKLTEWDEKWRSEMTKAKGEGFHLSFLSFFRLYVRLFLNSFGIQATLLPGSRVAPSIQALSTCWKSALDSLQILSDDFVKMSMLCYCQDSILVMSAYSAVFLLKLLSTQSIYHHIGESTANEIYRLIEKAGESYIDAANLSTTAISTAYHGGFLRSLLSNDIFRHRVLKQEEDPVVPIDPRLQNQVQQQQHPGPVQASPVQASYSHSVARPQEPLNYAYTTNAAPAHQPQPMQQEYHNAYAMRQQQQQQQQQAMEHQHGYGYGPTLPSAPHNATELEANYWKNMFIELGFGQTHDGPPTNVLAVSNTSEIRCIPAAEYIETHHAAQHQLAMHQQHQQAQMYQMHPHHHHQQVAVHQGYGH